jgi:hypothetical protein
MRGKIAVGSRESRVASIFSSGAKDPFAVALRLRTGD